MEDSQGDVSSFSSIYISSGSQIKKSSIKLLPENSEKVQCGICFNLEKRCCKLTSKYQGLIGFPKNLTYLLPTLKQVIKNLGTEVSKNYFGFY